MGSCRCHASSVPCCRHHSQFLTPAVSPVPLKVLFRFFDISQGKSCYCTLLSHTSPCLQIARHAEQSSELSLLNQHQANQYAYALRQQPLFDSSELESRGPKDASGHACASYRAQTWPPQLQQGSPMAMHVDQYQCMNRGSCFGAAPTASCGGSAATRPTAGEANGWITGPWPPQVAISIRPEHILVLSRLVDHNTHDSIQESGSYIPLRNPAISGLTRRTSFACGKSQKVRAKSCLFSWTERRAYSSGVILSTPAPCAKTGAVKYDV